MQFSIGNEGRQFTSWRHHHLEMIGSWKLERCVIHVEHPIEEALQYSMKIKNLRTINCMFLMTTVNLKWFISLLNRVGLLPLVCVLSISCVVACANEDAPKSGSQVSSLGTVSASIGVTEKKLTGFYHFKQMEMPR